MKDSLSLLLILGAAGFAAYYLYSQTHVQNQPSAAAQAAMQAAQAASGASSAGYEVSKLASGESAQRVAGSLVEWGIGMAAGTLAYRKGWVKR